MAKGFHEVVLVRHGETEWSKSGKHTGRTDIGLTETGERQADQLGGMLHGRSFALSLVSPLIRAQDTHDRAHLAKPAEVDADLLEWDYGVYEGITTAQTREEIPEWTVWTHPIIDGESVDEVGVRADRIIARALEADGDTVLFAHGHFLRILGARWLGMPAVMGQRLALNTATVSTLGYERDTRVLRRWNEGCHLRGIDVDI